MKHRHVWLGILLCLTLAPLRPARLEAQDRQPYTLEQLVRMVEAGVFPDGRILALARESCLGFTMDAEARNELREAGASEGLIASLRQICVRLPLVVTTIVVTPAQLELPVGASRPLRAQALANDSSRIANVTFEWSSEDTIVADVSMGGQVTGKAPGTTRIRVSTADGPVAMAQVRVVRAAAEAGAGDTATRAAARRSGKSAGTAAALGFVVPGGGEFYSGNTAKGVVVLLGAAAGLTAGYLITRDEVLSTTLTPTATPNCDVQQSVCTIAVDKQTEVEETRQIVVGAAIAGAFWLYGLVDGIRSAKRAPVTTDAMGEPGSGLSLELIPADGLRVSVSGDAELTLLRIRS